MSPIFIEIFFLLLIIFANGLLAMAEMAIIAARKTRLQKWANEGNVRAKSALELSNAPNSFLPAIQIGITLIGILAGAFGGATLAETLSKWIKPVPLIGQYGEALSIGIVVALTTYLALLGELIPKRIALSNAEIIATVSAGPVRFWTRLLSPAVRLLNFSTETVLRLIGIRSKRDVPVTQEEIKLMLDQGTEAGILHQTERDMVQRVFRFGQRTIGSLMTPRTDIVWLDTEDSKEEVSRKITESGFFRFPLIQSGVENVLGIVEVKDLFAASMKQEVLDLKAFAKPPLFVPESMPAVKVLEQFKKSGMPLALVVDEHGGIQGIVTLKDILEALVGDIASVDEPSEPNVIRREDGSWLLDGMLPIEDLKELLDIPLPEEESGSYHTLGGFVMLRLGRIPASGDHFDWNQVSFEVMDMDGRRVDKVLAVPSKKTSSSPKK